MPPRPQPFEVWVIDQGDSHPEGGGLLHIFDGDALVGDASSARPETVDLGGSALELCKNQTGSAPRRPHMVMFNRAQSHAIVAFVASGHVLFLEAPSRAPAACIDVGAQAHAAFPSPDEKYVVVANQNGKLLQRIATDYARGAFALDANATLDLAACTTPSGARCEDATLRPDNAPICPVIDSASRWVFVTLRGGGLLVVDLASTPMAVVAEYDKASIHPNGCGGVEAGSSMYITSGGGTPANPLEADVYALPLARIPPASPHPNDPAPKLVLSRDDEAADLHGAALSKDGRWLWLADRHGNRILIVDMFHDGLAGEFSLAGSLSPDPAPDLLDFAPSGAWAFAALRGPSPLTGNAPGVNNSVGATPGVAVLRVEEAGRSGALHGIAPLSKLLNGTETADPHALRVRARA